MTASQTKTRTSTKVVPENRKRSAMCMMSPSASVTRAAQESGFEQRHPIDRAEQGFSHP
jgi:hypothetical protein